MNELRKFLLDNDYFIKMTKVKDYWKLYFPATQDNPEKEYVYWSANDKVYCKETKEEFPICLDISSFGLKPLVIFDIVIWSATNKFPIEYIAYFNEEGKEVPITSLTDNDADVEFIAKERALIQLLSSSISEGQELDDYLEEAEELGVLDEFVLIVMRYGEVANEQM